MRGIFYFNNHRLVVLTPVYLPGILRDVIAESSLFQILFVFFPHMLPAVQDVGGNKKLDRFGWKRKLD